MLFEKEKMNFNLILDDKLKDLDNHSKTIRDNEIDVGVGYLLTTTNRTKKIEEKT